MVIAEPSAGPAESTSILEYLAGGMSEAQILADRPQLTGYGRGPSPASVHRRPSRREYRHRLAPLRSQHGLLVGAGRCFAFRNPGGVCARTHGRAGVGPRLQECVLAPEAKGR